MNALNASKHGGGAGEATHYKEGERGSNGCSRRGQPIRFTKPCACRGQEKQWRIKDGGGRGVFFLFFLAIPQMPEKERRVGTVSKRHTAKFEFMEFRNPGEIGIPASSSSSSGYKPSVVRGGSAFSKPTLFPSTSLVSPRAEGEAGGAGVGSGGVGRGGARNGNILGNTEALPPPTLESTPTATDRLPQSLGKNADQAAISNSSPGAAGVGLPADNSKPTTVAKTSTITAATNAAYISTKYKECLRNHAAALGGHVVDGCGEFMPSGDADTPEALKCAACGCHRSFHRRESDRSTGAANSYYHGTTRLPLLLPPPHPQAHPHHQKQFQLGGFSSSPSTAVRGTSGFVHFGGSNPSGSGGTTTESSSEERLNTGTPTPITIPRKRFRTKFTAEQKENMLAFAERVGFWKSDLVCSRLKDVHQKLPCFCHPSVFSCCRLSTFPASRFRNDRT
ncbi:hypothetical protein BHM03_00001521 [Ensete ventricosum]|nr:hypothetical protein BHM03_00001521 [Ensete ventricosum]